MNFLRFFLEELLGELSQNFENIINSNSTEISERNFRGAFEGISERILGEIHKFMRSVELLEGFLKQFLGKSTQELVE